MFIHMKTTLIIPDHLFRELKSRAARTGEKLSAVVAEVLHRGLQTEEDGDQSSMEPLPVHAMGKPTVDLADRDALYRAMEES